MRIERRFTRKGHSPYEGITFVKRSSEIKNPDGSTVFKIDNIDVPEQWSQLAVDILAQKYFRKAGIPQVDANGAPLMGLDGKPVLGGERDARQVFHRMAGCWMQWGKAVDKEISAQGAGGGQLRWKLSTETVGLDRGFYPLFGLEH